MTPTTAPQAGGSTDRPHQGRRRRRLPLVLTGIGGLAMAAVIAGMIGSANNWGQPEEAAPPPPAAAAPDTQPAPGPEVTADDDAPPDPDEPADQSEPDWRGLTYQDLNGAQLPVSPVHGPTHLSEETASGYSRDAAGAAIAATHWGIRVSPQVGPEIYVPTVERMDGDTTTMLTQVDTEYADARTSSGLPAGEPMRIYAQVIGYAIPTPVDDETEEVTVHLLSRGAAREGGEIMVSIVSTMVWSDPEGWVLRVPPGGQWSGTPVSGTAGYELFPDADDD